MGLCLMLMVLYLMLVILWPVFWVMGSILWSMGSFLWSMYSYQGSVCWMPVFRNPWGDAVCRPRDSCAKPFCRAFNTKTDYYPDILEVEDPQIPRLITMLGESPPPVYMAGEKIVEGTWLLAEIVKNHVEMIHISDPLMKATSIARDVRGLIEKYDFPSKAELNQELISFSNETDITRKAFDDFVVNFSQVFNWMRTSTSELVKDVRDVQRRRQEMYVIQFITVCLHTNIVFIYRIEVCNTFLGFFRCWLSPYITQLKLKLNMPIPKPIADGQALMGQHVQYTAKHLERVISKGSTVTESLRASGRYLESASIILQKQKSRINQKYDQDRLGFIARQVYQQLHKEAEGKFGGKIEAVGDTATKIETASDCIKQTITGLQHLVEMLSVSEEPILDMMSTLTQVEAMEEGLAALTEVYKGWERVRINRAQAMIEL